MVQLSPDDLSDSSRGRVERIEHQSELSLATIRANRGIDPDRQIRLASEIRSSLSHYAPLLAWSGFPKQAQRECAIKLIWDFLAPQKGGGVKTSKQLAFKLSRLSGGNSVRELIETDINNPNLTYKLSPTDACDSNLSFVRTWMSFRLPRYLSALERIQREVLTKEGLEAGAYEFYAARVENLFIGQAAIALDEYGLPPEVVLKLKPVLDPEATLDDAIEALRKLEVSALNLTAFERELLQDTIRHLQPQDLAKLLCHGKSGSIDLS